jgi:hypothetical protein
MSTPTDDPIDRAIARAEANRHLARFRLWYTWWSDIALDLAAMGVAPDVIIRMGERLIELTRAVLVVTGGDGEQPRQPPAA